MKIVFVSNYFNHHQKPFCEKLYRRLGADFSFVSTAMMREERRKLGYSQDDCPEYVLLSYAGEDQRRKAISLINQADVVIAGSAPNDMLADRIGAGNLVFRYAERPYKKNASFIKKLYHCISWRQRDFWKKNVYMLCASAYAAGDYASVGMYKGRTYKWGYFPAVKAYNAEQLLAGKKRNTLLWCGRFIDWKHPDDAIRIARELKKNGYDFQLNMIGAGVMEEELKALVKAYELENVVYFLGSMAPEQVRSYMEEAGIYLFTSDRQEGWGAVLNESMNSACAVVACNAIGSVPFLIQHGVSGLVYETGNIDALYDKVKYLLENCDDQRKIGLAAYREITENWNAEIAANRFLKLTEEIQKHGGCDLYENGPCSRT